MSSFETKYQAGEKYGDDDKDTNIFADPLKLANDILKDCSGIRKEASPKQIASLLQELVSKGPLDDKKGNTELLIGILTSLPSDSDIRTQLTNKLIDTLWDNLQHPPLSYLGGDVKYEVVNPQESQKPDPKTYDSIEFKVPDSDVTLREHVPQAPDGLHHYRTPDGSYNNPIQPNLGRAGAPYAKTVRNTKRLHGVKPDPGLLFDLLMARDDQHFIENPAGISAMFFYHASIIIHDIFRTNRTDPNRSDTSSYLDLAPLYGSSLKDQLEIRTMKGGKLKPDTFHEKRLLGQPAGVNVMLVLYSRYHNYVCDILLQINENGRFTLECDGKDGATPEEKARAVARQDHDLFNVARLVVGGLYVNISLHDYLRAITNTHHSSSDWTLDPRVEIKAFDGEGAPRGVGNQVSAEFNLLYRFHSCISKKDERWMNDFFYSLFDKGEVKDLSTVSLEDFGLALLRFEQRIDKDPSKRTFDGLKRQDDGTFKNEDLVRILKEGMEDPAGVFGARTIPKALKIIEVLGINQARKWQVASLNEFRDFFGLKRYEKFTDINSEPEIAKILEKLYTDPDMVELYPGLMIEDAKPIRNAGCGISPTYSVGRAVLSDAVTLVRSDRFNTLDYTVSNLTSWGYNEVQSDNKTLGGSMLYKLIQRGVPGWFPFNSVAVMQPMYTKKANENIAKELGTIDQYTLDDPAAPRKTVVIMTSEAIKQALGQPKQYVVPWLQPLNILFPGKKDFGWYMLAGDEQRNFDDRTVALNAIKKIPNLQTAIKEFVQRVGFQLIEKERFELKEGLDQIDLIRDVAIPLNTQLLADLFYFDLRTDENPSGTLGVAELYGQLLDIRTWGVNNTDPAQSWNRRRRAQEGAKAVIESTRKLVDEVAHSHGTLFSLGSNVVNDFSRKRSLKEGSLRSCGYKFVHELLEQGYSAEKVTDSLWLNAFGGIGVPVTAYYEVMEFFLRKENEHIWSEVQTLAKNNDDAGIYAYVVEAQRLTSTQRNMRVATQPATLEGKTIEPGNLVVMLLGEAGRNPAEVPNAHDFDPHRQTDSVTSFSYGQHECLAKEIARSFITGMVKLAADLKELRPAPGEMGKVKTIKVGTETTYLNDSWSYLCFEASTWKLHFNGRGLGNYQGQEQPSTTPGLLQYYHTIQKRKADLLKSS
ncbi:heme peroxidase [Annulohypoxylon maeteangense]|uniref:heme peroxidase n=1 Tax=Annulohypoxylon maeteangense TaxID=1927788 RepID=UPI002007B92C|nr:heme peroxidase [Annulohypoxylon maeteangense]KAI0885259.1 heme peroxidase [Annulohypoxylon maeteangense]